MRVFARIEVPGEITAFRFGDTPPAEGIAFEYDDNGKPRRLYVDGRAVGTVVGWPESHSDAVVTVGGREPEHVVSRTTIEAYLNLPTPEADDA